MNKKVLTSDEIKLLGEPVLSNNDFSAYLIDTTEKMRTAFSVDNYTCFGSTVPDTTANRYFSLYTENGLIYAVLKGNEPIHYPYFKHSKDGLEFEFSVDLSDNSRYVKDLKTIGDVGGFIIQLSHQVTAETAEIAPLFYKTTEQE